MTETIKDLTNNDKREGWDGPKGCQGKGWYSSFPLIGADMFQDPPVDARNLR